MVRRVGVPPELNYSYIQYLKVILKRRAGKVDPARSFMLSQRRETPKAYSTQPLGGFVYDQYLEIIEDRLHLKPGLPTIIKVNKMRRMGGYI